MISSAKKIIEKINTEFKFDVQQIPSLIVLENFQQHTVTGTVLYPLSGADICYPIIAFPRAERLVLIDRDPFMTPSTSKDSDLLFNFKMMNKITAHFKSGLHGINSFGNNAGYDITDAYNFLIAQLGLFDITDEINDFGLSTLLLYRLRAGLGYEIVSVDQIENLSIYKIVIKSPSHVKEIFFVQHKLGENSLEYDWLLKQKYEFGGLFLKAYVTAAKEYCIPEKLKQERKQILEILGENNIKKQFPVISDSSPYYGLNKIPPFFKTTKENHVIEINRDMSFGYGDAAIITHSGNLLQSDLVLKKKRKKSLLSEIKDTPQSITTENRINYHSLFCINRKDFKELLDIEKSSGNSQAQKLWDKNWGLTIRS